MLFGDGSVIQVSFLSIFNALQSTPSLLLPKSLKLYQGPFKFTFKVDIHNKLIAIGQSNNPRYLLQAHLLRQQRTDHHSHRS